MKIECEHMAQMRGRLPKEHRKTSCADKGHTEEVTREGRCTECHNIVVKVSMGGGYADPWVSYGFQARRWENCNDREARPGRLLREVQEQKGS